MNPGLTVEGHIVNAQRLESLMLKDLPIVPPDSVIKTFSHLKGNDVDMVLTQDKEGLAQGSFIIRRGDWSKFFLDTWFDPLYRSYNFQKADTHALVNLLSPKSYGKYSWFPGTHCTVASKHTFQVSHCSATDNELLSDSGANRTGGSL